MTVKKGTIALLVLCVSLVFCSCGLAFDFSEDSSTVMKQETMTLNEAEVKLVALSYKNRYENYYSALLGSDFWEEEVKEGVSFERFILSDTIINELQSMLSLNIIAKKESITLSQDELAELNEKATALYASMTDDDKEYTGATEKQIASILKKYRLAYLAEQFLLSNHTIEISDEESRVIEIEVIHTKTVLDADHIYERISQGEDFGTLAKENTIDNRIEYAVSRQDLSDSFSSILFSLEEGEISQVVDHKGEGFIFRVVSSYSMLLSKSHKHNLLAKTKYETLKKAIGSYRINGEVQASHEFFASLSLKTKGIFSDFSLFD